MADTIRTFIAIELTEEIKENIRQFIELIKNPEDKITWVLPFNVHLTLKFLGNIHAGDINSIKGIIRESAKKYPPFEISIKGTGVFPSQRNPRVVWTGVDTGRERVKEIYGDLENGLSAIGIQKEDRSYTPHFTLGRVKYIKDLKRFSDNILKYKENLFGNLKVSGISLMKSTLTPKGSVYEKLFEAKLGD